ncbi:MAG TPA: Hsp20/alpha crystallin family protein [Phycisphaerales bacterium]|nr:Hsp20/alpha crystallin family protein [Phycisphaerales bacterium]
MLPTIRRTNSSVRPFGSDGFGWIDRDFGRLVRQMFNENGQDPLAVYPVDIREDDNNVYIDAELPGFTKDQIDVTFEKGVVHISAERSDETREGTDLVKERRYTRTQRSFSLPNVVDDAKVEATLDHGVLHLVLPKRQEMKPRKIAISNK